MKVLLIGLVAVLPLAASGNATELVDETIAVTPKRSIYSLLRDHGRVGGMSGYELRQVADATACGGLRVDVTRPRTRPAPADAPLAALFAAEMPRDLDFERARERSLRRFQTWVEASQASLAGVRKRLDDTRPADGEDRYVAAARLAQASLRFASMLARAPIPKDVRTGEFAGEKTAAYCARMVEAAEPLVDAARDAIDVCAAGAWDYPSRWWAAVCVPLPH